MLKYIRTNPTVLITMVLALTLVVLGLYSIFPAEWFGASSAVINPVRLIFGLFIMTPSLPVLFWMLKNKKSYIEHQKKVKPFLFWMGVTYFYLTAFRILAYGLFPPVAILYLACGVITMSIWLGVRK